MHTSLAHKALQNTLDCLRTHPEVRRNLIVGSLGDIRNIEDATRLCEGLDDGKEDCCIGRLIRAQCRLVAPNAEDGLMAEVVRIICAAHQHKEITEKFITNFNDIYCQSVDDAIRFLEKPLRKSAEPIRTEALNWFLSDLGA